MLNESSPSPAVPSAQNGPAGNASPPLNTLPDSRKTYLSLLPPEQIIEICLLFEPHVPVHVKATVWPADLEAAILELKTKLPTIETVTQHAAITPGSTAHGTSQPSHVGPPAHQVHPPGHHVPLQPSDEDPPMGSLRDPAEVAKEKASAAAASISTPSPAPQPPSNGDPQSSARQGTPGSHAGTPGPQGQAHHANLHPPAPYPYPPYGYPMPPQPQGQQAAYPHAPYYPPSAYPPPYSYPHYPPPPGYPTPPPGHSPPPPPPPSNQGPFSTNPLARPPPHPSIGVPQPPPPPSGEDLPSYEEMIVEALTDCGDLEGAAPKDLFTWMASRYPLQTNFRPSASQALQKAYKRGRLEKRTGGKYRLNPTWEGGATSKRTTRRPQTLAQTTYAMHHPPPPPSSPFTNAPLQHPHPQQHPPPPAQQQPYNGYPYPYPYGHYPGYPPPNPPGQPARERPSVPAQPPAENAITANKPADDKDEAGDNGDAWQAAQHILQAINFAQNQSTNGAPTGNAAAGPSASSGALVHTGTSSADDDLNAVLNALASAAAAASAEPIRTTLTDDERASLQAQLALLAAQLTEIADGEDEIEDAPAQTTSAPAALQPAPPTVTQHAPSPAPPALQPHPEPYAQSQAQFRLPAESQPQPQPQPRPVAPPPPPIAAYSGAHLVLDINAFPEVFRPLSAPATGLASGAQTEVEGGEDSDDDDDDDMEDVVVPLAPAVGQGALRT
ncbi:hypothetical protein C8Q80DRAFT_411529 [Daedaleopsis nitida]|nr:hypothetical protein C8Q80DRAFT_411529 [Daedaleopsis nitida]